MYKLKKSLFQKSLSVLLAVVLIFSAMPFTVFAETTDLVSFDESAASVEVDEGAVNPSLHPSQITLAPRRVRGFEIDGFGVERDELSWYLSGDVSSNTTIENGFLRVAADQPQGIMTVKAYVTHAPLIYAIAEVVIGGPETSLIYNLPAGLHFDQYPSLREVYEDYFMMGVAGDAHLIAGQTGIADLRGQLIGHHYNSWSFENSMKPQPLRGNNAANRLQPSNQWPGIAGPTNTINAARARYDGMTFAGHTTAWHSQSPDWMWDRHPDGHTDRDVALENLQFHVHETFRQFGDQLSSMDVVNEALGSVNPTNPSDWRDALTRGEGWSPTLGSDWVMYAFVFAAEIVDELGLDVTLYYNDFLLHTTNKGIAAYTMVRDINQMHADGDIIHPITGEVFQRPNGGLLIEGVGMQDRQSGVLDIDGFSRAINMFADLGVVISITEMDLSWRISSPDGLLTEEEQIAQGQQMARFFEMIRRYATGPATAGSPYPRVVERITFWGIDDTHSWSPGEPMLFGRPTEDTIPGKEALRAVLDPFQFLEDHPWTPEEIPPVPGVHVFNLQDDGFSGVNIILGQDEAVWPFSTAGADGVVAFNPQPGATYHMLVYYQSFETFGLEAHWLRDNSSNNFTEASIISAEEMGQMTRGNQPTGPSDNVIPTQFFNPGVGGSFAWLETTFTMPEDAEPDGLLGNIALRGIHQGDGVLVHAIVIHRLDDEGNQVELLVNYPYQLPLVRPEIPGILVPEPNEAQSNGRADIIIGSGRDVWPFADAHESGLAFEPEPGVTYRLMFNVRTTGANGWRVRWIPGTGGEDYTTADGAIVNNYPVRVSTFGLGVPTPEAIPEMPVASVIPSHQNQGVSAAGVYTLIQDITLNPDEIYQGLIGNIALRGTGGSGSFVVNWISIQALEAGPGSEAAQTLNFWPFGVDAFDDFQDDVIDFMQQVDGFAPDHFTPNALNVANNYLTAITRLGENSDLDVDNPPQVGDTLLAGRISGGIGATGPEGALRNGRTHGFLVGNTTYEWLVNDVVVQTSPSHEFTILSEHVGYEVNVRLSSDWEIGALMSEATPAVVADDVIDPELIAARATLLALITEAEALNQADFTAETWAALQVALESARAALQSDDVNEITEKTTALHRALNTLELAPPIEPTQPPVPSPIPPLPGIPGLPPLPVFPGLPGMPGMPGIPELPGIPPVPSLPTVPSIPTFTLPDFRFLR